MFTVCELFLTVIATAEKNEQLAMSMGIKAKQLPSIMLWPAYRSLGTNCISYTALGLGAFKVG